MVVRRQHLAAALHLCHGGHHRIVLVATPLVPLQPLDMGYGRLVRVRARVGVRVRARVRIRIRASVQVRVQIRVRVRVRVRARARVRRLLTSTAATTPPLVAALRGGASLKPSGPSTVPSSSSHLVRGRGRGRV